MMKKQDAMTRNTDCNEVITGSKDQNSRSNDSLQDDNYHIRPLRAH